MIIIDCCNKEAKNISSEQKAFFHYIDKEYTFNKEVVREIKLKITNCVYCYYIIYTDQKFNMNKGPKFID